MIVCFLHQADTNTVAGALAVPGVEPTKFTLEAQDMTSAITMVAEKTSPHALTVYTSQASLVAKFHGLTPHELTKQVHDLRWVEHATLKEIVS